MRGDEFTHYLMPGFCDLDFVQALAQAEPLHHLRQEISRGFTAIGPKLSFRQTAPFSQRSGAN
jgi:hypothetical protein